MDSLGATARTPRFRRSALRNNTFNDNDHPTPRSYDGRRHISDLHGSGSSPFIPRRSDNLDVMLPVLQVDGIVTSSDTKHIRQIRKTPRHSYEMNKSNERRTNAEITVASTNKKENTPLLTVDPNYSTIVNESSMIFSWKHHISRIILYGLLNIVILIPLMISFAQIIFRDPAFQSYMPQLVKLVLTSAAVHQFCFTLKSSLSFSIGQVQDAGLIFLSAMATSIVQGLQDSQGDQKTLIATTLFTLAISTALLGVALVITGKLKLASFVQYLPMPVIGGYLAFIGFYCLEAGVSMMSGIPIKGILDWPNLLNVQSCMLIAPGILGGIGVFMLLSRVEHVMVLPAAMAAILFVFYFVLAVLGISLEDARQLGWISPLPSTQVPITEVYQMYNYQYLDTAQMFRQIPTWIAMYFVVAFSSSLDVAAVEMALGTPLDYNHELQTVGISNLVSGLAGGFTGSYIFSQTIFTLRSNLHSRLVGVLVCGLEVVLVFCPISIVAYVPKLFFGALQTLIAVDLMVEYLWHARHKMLLQEYLIVWFTFAVTCSYNLEFGIISGIVVAGFNFIRAYIAVSNVRRVVKRSHAERNLKERALLQKSHLAIVTLELDGFIFFGSSVKIMEEVRRHVLVSASEAVISTSMSIISPSFRANGSFLSTVFQYEMQVNSTQTPRQGVTGCSDELRTLDDHHEYSTCTKSKEQGQLSMRPARTRFFVLDFERVRGIDATAARSCIRATKQLLAQHGILLIFTCVRPDIQQILHAHDILDDEELVLARGSQEGGTLVFETVDKALEWCEDELLAEQGVLPLGELVPVSRGGDCSAQVLDALLPKSNTNQEAPKMKVKSTRGSSVEDTSDTDDDDEGDRDAVAEESVKLSDEIAQLYIQPVRLFANEVVYEAGSVVDGLYFIGYGKVDVFLPSKLHERLGPGFLGKRRIQRVCQGGILGVSEMVLNKRHQYTAQATTETFLFFLSMVKFSEMKIQHPMIASRFQKGMMQTLARTVMEANIADG